LSIGSLQLKRESSAAGASEQRGKVGLPKLVQLIALVALQVRCINSSTTHHLLKIRREPASLLSC